MSRKHYNINIDDSKSSQKHWESCMKFIILIALALTSTLSFGAAQCPANSQTIKICKSTPKAGDGDIARAMGSIAICEQADSTILVLEKDNESESGVATVTVRMGGTSYSIIDGDVGISLSLQTGVRPSSTTKARLTISFIKAKVSNSSTFTCK